MGISEYPSRRLPEPYIPDMVGSSRFAAPKRLFLGSTAARILAGTEAPVIVVPRGE
jgi:hypothetical protein